MKKQNKLLLAIASLIMISALLVAFTSSNSVSVNKDNTEVTYTKADNTLSKCGGEEKAEKKADKKECADKKEKKEKCGKAEETEETEETESDEEKYGEGKCGE